MLTLQILPQSLTVCRAERLDGFDLSSGLFFIGRTDEELSLVCRTACVPAETVAREDGWRAFRIEGMLDFSLVGILSKISAVLADNGIGIFAVSTYNTDYILVKAENFGRAMAALEAAGYEICEFG